MWDLVLSKKIKMACDIASGKFSNLAINEGLALHWIQAYEYIHMDLTLANIKLTTQGQCKLDLGTEQLLYKKRVTPHELRER